jgi:hypothetical protein
MFKRIKNGWKRFKKGCRSLYRDTKKWWNKLATRKKVVFGLIILIGIDLLLLGSLFSITCLATGGLSLLLIPPSIWAIDVLGEEKVHQAPTELMPLLKSSTKQSLIITTRKRSHTFPSSKETEEKKECNNLSKIFKKYLNPSTSQNKPGQHQISINCSPN